MTTSTDLHDDDPGSPDDADTTLRRGEPEPSAYYDGALTPADIDARFKAAFAKAADEHGGMFTIPGGIVRDLQEDHRRAHVRLLGPPGAVRGPATPRQSIQSEARPTEHEDGSLTIVCAGPCGEEKPVSKFPTLKGGNGRRGTVCRACEAAIRAEKKSPGKA
jgi:hypothetical protein